MILTVVSSKRDVGKTTLAVHAACWLKQRGWRVAVVDADPGGNAAEWLARCAAELPVQHAASADDASRLLPRLATIYDAVVLDGPELDPSAARELLAAADIVLLPVGPLQLDLWASLRAAQAVHGARLVRAERGRPRAFTVLNRVQPQGRTSTIASAAVRRFGLPMARTVLQLRPAYAEAARLGRTVWQLGLRGQAAAHELSRLFSEVTGEAPMFAARTLDAAVVAPLGARPPAAVAASAR